MIAFFENIVDLNEGAAKAGAAWCASVCALSVKAMFRKSQAVQVVN